MTKKKTKKLILFPRTKKKKSATTLSSLSKKIKDLQYAHVANLEKIKDLNEDLEVFHAKFHKERRHQISDFLILATALVDLMDTVRIEGLSDMAIRDTVAIAPSMITLRTLHERLAMEIQGIHYKKRYPDGFY